MAAPPPLNAGPSSTPSGSAVQLPPGYGRYHLLSRVADTLPTSGLARVVTTPGPALLSEYDVTTMGEVSPADYGLSLAWGPADTRKASAGHYQGDKIIERLGLYNCSSQIMKHPGDAETFHISHVYILARCYMAYKNLDIKKRQRLLLAELFIPRIPDTHRLDQKAADELVVAAFNDFFSSHLVPTVYGDIATAYTNALRPPSAATGTSEKDPGGILYIHGTLPRTLTWPTQATITIKECEAFASWIAPYMGPNYKMDPITAHITMHLMYAKKKTVTEEFLTRVQDAINSDLGTNVNLDPIFIADMYKDFGHLLDENSVILAFGRWYDFLPPKALRMRLTLAQTPLAGLTAIAAIREALTKFPDFNWEICDIVLPGQLQNVVDAFKVIGNNPFYGYKRNLGEASSTRYKVVTYVAMHLLTKGGTGSTYKNYRGLLKNPPEKTALDEEIDAYLSSRHTYLKSQAGSPALLQLLKAYAEDSNKIIPSM